MGWQRESISIITEELLQVDGFANAVNVILGLWGETRDLGVDSRGIEAFGS